MFEIDSTKTIQYYRYFCKQNVQKMVLDKMPKVFDYPECGLNSANRGKFVGIAKNAEVEKENEGEGEVEADK
jgi:hypothetical protein